MTERVFVGLRIRPPLNKEELRDVCVTPIDENKVCVGEKRVFTSDHVFDISCDSAYIFETRVKPLIDSFLGGYNSTIMAYGQTGTGKTHTMSALAPLTIEYICEMMAGLGHVSFQLLEVYGETLHDLLAVDGAVHKPLQLLDGQQQTHVVGASRVKVRDLEEAHTLLEHGSQMRTTAATSMNAHSSRSHSILTIFNHAKMSKIHLVDLAGSERNKKTNNVGLRFKESVGINTGLLALGNVIRALSQNAHVPYRASKLTRLLQDSLGGNSRTFFLACVAPDSSNLDETVRTLQYSSKAMHILNEPLPNYDQFVANQQKQLKRIQQALNLSTEEAVQRYANGDAFAEEQAAEIRRLTSVVNELETELRGAKLELKKDEVIFANQLKEMRRLVKENQSLRSQLDDLTAAKFQLPVEFVNTQEAYYSTPRSRQGTGDRIDNSSLRAVRAPDSLPMGTSIGVSTAYVEPCRNDSQVPDYLNLYSVQSDTPGSHSPFPTPAALPSSARQTEVATMAKPSRLTTPTTGAHPVPQEMPSTSALKGSGKPQRSPPVDFTPPKRQLFVDALENMHTDTNAWASRLALEDQVCSPMANNDSDSVVVVTESPPKMYVSYVPRNITPPRTNTTVQLFASQSVLSSPHVSIIRRDSLHSDHHSNMDADLPMGGSSVDGDTTLKEVLKETLFLHHTNKQLRGKLESVVGQNDELSRENATLKSELLQIQEMLKF